MNKKEQLVRQYNEVMVNKAECYEDAFIHLNKLFKQRYKIHGDAQIAYDELASSFPFIQDHFCFQIMGWKLYVEDYSLEEEVLESFNAYYDANCSSLDDVIFELTPCIYDAMSNAGCDQETAFNSISEDVCLDGITLVHSGYQLCEI